MTSSHIHFINKIIPQMRPNNKKNNLYKKNQSFFPYTIRVISQAVLIHLQGESNEGNANDYLHKDLRARESDGDASPWTQTHLSSFWIATSRKAYCSLHRFTQPQFERHQLNDVIRRDQLVSWFADRRHV